MVDALLVIARAVLVSRARLATENLALLRQQLAILNRSVKRPRLRLCDRVFWSWLSRVWPSWRSALLIVKPETVIRWHRQGFRLYWRWKSRPKGGRPTVDAEIRSLIRRMREDNVTWGAPRVQAEREPLGFKVSKATVAKYMKPTRKPPSQTWKTFLKNHMAETAAIDFFVVPTVTFQLLYGFVVLRHERRDAQREKRPLASSQELPRSRPATASRSLEDERLRHREEGAREAGRLPRESQSFRGRETPRGSEDTTAVHKLGVPETLRRSLRSTNPIESCFSMTRKFCRNVKNWKNADMAMRWAGAMLQESQKRFHRLKGCRSMSVLLTALRTQEVDSISQTA